MGEGAGGTWRPASVRQTWNIISCKSEGMNYVTVATNFSGKYEDCSVVPD